MLDLVKKSNEVLNQIVGSYSRSIRLLEKTMTYDFPHPHSTMHAGSLSNTKVDLKMKQKLV